MRVEPYPILSATASTTESSGRNLSRFTLSHVEALGYVMPPWHSDEELMISTQYSPVINATHVWRVWLRFSAYPITIPHNCITKSDKLGEMVQA